MNLKRFHYGGGGMVIVVPSIKNLTISEAAYSVHGGHLDDKGKHIIYEGVECLVSEHPPGKVGH